MTGLTWVHIAGGIVALLAGTVAVVVRKGGPVHAAAGRAFVVAMGVLGLTAAAIGPFATPVQSPIGGLLVVYFVGTGWLAVRRSRRAPGRAEQLACAFALLAGAAIFWEGIQRSFAPPGTFVDPPRPEALVAMGVLCVLAGLGDLRWLRRRTWTPRQRVARHLWRMCVALFIATGSFFLGQMDVLPTAARHLPTLLLLAFAPLGVLAFVSVRHRRTGYPLPRPRRTATP